MATTMMAMGMLRLPGLVAAVLVAGAAGSLFLPTQAETDTAPGFLAVSGLVSLALAILKLAMNHVPDVRPLPPGVNMNGLRLCAPYRFCVRGDQ